MSRINHPTEQPNTTFSLPLLTARQKSNLLRYAELVLNRQQAMQTHTGKNILHYTLLKKRKHIRLQHYPLGDRIDLKTGGHYFYHCHRENLTHSEHGHFHCFLRKNFIQKRIKPTPLPDWDLYLDNAITHLIAIAMDRYGQPIRLFTVNRWITKETWFDAHHLPDILKRFKMTLTDSDHWQVLDQWVEGMLHLFAPQIAWLHQRRDAQLLIHKQANLNDNLYENKAIEELSEIQIDLPSQIHWILNS